MRNAPLHERAAMLKEFMLLMLVAGASGVAWACFFGQFEACYISLPIGFFMFLFIALIDQSIASSDWSLHNILRHPAAQWSRELWARLSVRVTITAVLSYATSTGAAMAMFGAAILMQLDHIRMAENQQIEERFDTQTNSFLDRMVGPERKTVKELKDAAAIVRPQHDEAMKRQVDAQARLEVAEQDMARESTGQGGRFRGQGPRYREAQGQADAARADLARANRDIAIYGPRSDAVQKKLDTAQAALAQAEIPLRPQLEQMEAAKEKELQPRRQDALLSYMALISLEEDPVKGRAARWFHSVMLGVLMVIELAFFTVRGFFAQPSLYMLTMRKNTLEEAERLDAEHERNLRQIRNWKGIAGLISNDDPPLKPLPPNDNEVKPEVRETGDD
jgi:hypothetical protein